MRNHSFIPTLFIGAALAGCGPIPEDHATSSVTQEITCNGSDQLYKEQRLNSGQWISSCDGRTRLTMRTDGDLVLSFGGYNDTHDAYYWHTNTAGNPGAWATMQGDGNFVVYTASGAPLFATASGPRGAFIAVQNDGNLVVYDNYSVPKWASHTSVPPTSRCTGYLCAAGAWWRSCDETVSLSTYGVYGFRCHTKGTSDKTTWFYPIDSANARKCNVYSAFLDCYDSSDQWLDPYSYTWH